MATAATGWFGLAERETTLATEVRAGATTFMVMAYIVFVNPIVLGFVGVPGLEGFVIYTAIKVLRGRGGELHWMIYLTSGAFVVYFALPLIESWMR